MATMESPYAPLILPGLVLGIVFGWLGILWFLGWLRRRQLRELALSIGLIFSPSGRGFSEQIPQFRGSWIAPPRRAFDFAFGPRRVEGLACELVLGDCSAYGRRARSHVRTVNDHGSPSFMAIKLPGTGSRNQEDMPRFFLFPSNLKLTLAKGHGLTSFQSHSNEFDRTYNVYTTSRRFASDLLEPLMMEHLLRDAPPAMLDIEEGWIMLVGNRPWSPNQFLDSLAWLDRFVAQWPRYLLTDMQRREERRADHAAAVAAAQNQHRTVPHERGIA